MPFRIVGSHEYLSVINQLVQLAESSSKEEIATYDKLIAEQDEFSFFSGMLLDHSRNRNYPKKNKKLPAKDKFKRRSLAWLLALARVEVGATVAMYGKMNSAFDFVAPDGFGREEYYQLLANDAADHINALKTDPLLNQMVADKSEVNSDTIAYLRRLRVVNDMLLASRGFNDQDFIRSANEYLQPVTMYAWRLAKKAEDATIDLTWGEKGSEIGRNVTNQENFSPTKGTVTAVSPITRSCQQSFLGRYGRGR